jgi:hypothetical protein
MQLTAENVNRIFMDCLFDEGENTKDAIIGKGIQNDFGFEPSRLRGHTNDILDMIYQLPSAFDQKVGGGWSFLNMAINKGGEQWADSHQTMEQLLALGTAIDRMGFNLPRDKWNIFPGGMPYVYVKK